jgi:lipopolysaccharide transport system permease protein
MQTPKITSTTNAFSAKELASLPTIVIEPANRWLDLRIRDVWEYRELLFFLAWRDISVRYKQTVLGAAWAVIQPFFNMIVFTLFFGEFAGIPSNGVPYPVFSFAGLLAWQYFATAVDQSSNSLVGNSNLVSKVYFPRLLIPLSSLLPGLVDFCIAFVLMIGMMIVYGIAPTWNLLWLPVFLLLALVTALGTGLWLSALNVQYRDIRYIIPFLTQLWLFASPVAYPSSIIPEKWRLLYGLNPMASVIEGFRWALLGTNTAPGPMVFASAACALLLAISGLLYFRKMEQVFADMV